jgi:hypothetical protein
MASALDTIAHVVLPNLIKIKGVPALIGAMERRDASPFAHVWEQTGVEHAPQVSAKERGGWRFGVMSLPAPTEMGEAYMCAFVTKQTDAAITRYFTLEYDYALATKSAKTIVCEREGSRTVKHGDGPTLTDDFETDASAFVDAIIAVLGA